MADNIQILTDQIAQEFLDGRRIELTPDTPLIENEIIDSLGIFQLLGFIKDRFGIEVAPEHVNVENFATINAIARLVERSS